MGVLRERIEEHIRRHALIEPGGEVCCLVSGGADSTCMWHELGAEVVELDGAGLTEAELREQRYSLARDRLRATGHTASDQVETILYRLASRGSATGIEPRLAVWRSETEAYCAAEGLAFRVDASNAGSKRGLIRDEILPLLRRLHPAADKNL